MMSNMIGVSIRSSQIFIEFMKSGLLPPPRTLAMVSKGGRMYSNRLSTTFVVSTMKEVVRLDGSLMK
jgi:hypothetical protein